MIACIYVAYVRERVARLIMIASKTFEMRVRIQSSMLLLEMSGRSRQIRSWWVGRNRRFTTAGLAEAERTLIYNPWSKTTSLQSHFAYKKDGLYLKTIDEG